MAQCAWVRAVVATWRLVVSATFGDDHSPIWKRNFDTHLLGRTVAVHFASPSIVVQPLHANEMTRLLVEWLIRHWYFGAIYVGGQGAWILLATTNLASSPPGIPIDSVNISDVARTSEVHLRQTRLTTRKDECRCMDDVLMTSCCKCWSIYVTNPRLESANQTVEANNSSDGVVSVRFRQPVVEIQMCGELRQEYSNVISSSSVHHEDLAAYRARVRSAVRLLWCCGSKTVWPNVEHSTRDLAFSGSSWWETNWLCDDEVQ